MHGKRRSGSMERSRDEGKEGDSGWAVPATMMPHAEEGRRSWVVDNGGKRQGGRGEARCLPP